MSQTSEYKLILDFLSSGKKTITRAVGMSMFPWILPNENMVIEPFYVENIKIGKVVIFISDNRLIAHRVIKLDFENKICTTKGDGNLKADLPIEFDKIVGIVIKTQNNRAFWTQYSVGNFGYLIAKCSWLLAPINWFFGRIVNKASIYIKRKRSSM